MTTLAQVRHVARKDVRQFRWLILVYLIGVTLSTSNAFGLHEGTSGLWTLEAPLIVIFGMAIAATFVQSDSPSRTNAFWVTRPLDATAVLITKLALITVLLIGVAILGEIVGLLAYQLSAREIVGFVMDSIRAYGAWLLVAVIVGAFTPDFRTFAATVLAAAIALLFALQLFVFRDGHTKVPISVPLLGVGVAVATLGYFYKRRDPRLPWLLWALGALAILGVFTSVISPPPSTSAALAAGDAGPRIELADSSAIVQGDNVRLRLYAERMDSRHSFTFSCDTTIAHLRDGSTVPVNCRFGWVYLQRASMPIDASLRYSPEPRSVPFGGGNYPFNDKQRVALAGRLASIEIAGRINEYSPAVLATIPLRKGATAVGNGTRLGILRVTYADSLTVDLLRSSVTPQQSFPSGSAALQAFPDGGMALDGFFTGGSEAPNFALVNDVLHEAVLLENKGANGSSSWLVLPGAPLQQSTLHLGAMDDQQGSRATIKPDANWMRDARLVVIAWRHVGRYGIHTELPVRNRGS